VTGQRKPKAKVDVHKLVSRLNTESKTLLEREIIAPLLPGGRIRTRLGGMIYEFKLRVEFAGWGHFRPINEREAELLGEALPWERGAYLEQFPALRMILLWPDPDPGRPGTWWATPFNESDAHQRFAFSADPLPVFLCDSTGGAERFERVLARVDGNVLWFDGPDALADPAHAEWLRDAAAQPETVERFLPGLAGSERLALLYWQIRQTELALAAQRRQSAEAEHRRRTEVERRRRAEARHQNREQQREWLRHEALRGHLEENLRHALAKAGATLLSYSEIPNAGGSPGQLVVEWSESGQRRRYRSTIDPRMTVVSSGICLSGRDRDFDLTSLVSVMTGSPWC